MWGRLNNESSWGDILHLPLGILCIKKNTKKSFSRRKCCCPNEGLKFLLGFTCLGDGSEFLNSLENTWPKSQNKLSTEHVYLLRWFQYKNCIWLGILEDFIVFSLKTLYFLQQSWKMKIIRGWNVWNKRCSLCSKLFWRNLKNEGDRAQKPWFWLYWLIDNEKKNVFRP